MKKALSVLLVAVLISALFIVPANAIHWNEDECSIDSSGNYHPAHAWGYVFHIDSMDYMEGATTALFTSEEAYLNGIGNAKWKAHVLLAPTGEEYEYEVVAAFEYIGCSGQDAINNRKFDFENGKMLLVASDSGTRPDTNSDGSLVYPNWEDRAACWGLVNTIGAKVTLSDVDFSLGLMPEDDLTVTVENNPNKPDTSTDSSVPEGTVSEDNASEDDASEGTASEGTVSEDNASQEASAEGSDDESTAEPVESSTVEKVFQILFIVIMTVGIVGLPVYYWFNSKKKAMNTTDENEDNGGENE